MVVEEIDRGDAAWNQYGKAMIRAMAEVSAEVPDQVHGLLLETADYWLSLGLVIGIQHQEEASRLLNLIEAESTGQDELGADAEAFCAEALG